MVDVTIVSDVLSQIQRVSLQNMPISSLAFYKQNVIKTGEYFCSNENWSISSGPSRQKISKMLRATHML